MKRVIPTDRLALVADAIGWDGAEPGLHWEALSFLGQGRGWGMFSPQDGIYAFASYRSRQFRDGGEDSSWSIVSGLQGLEDEEHFAAAFRVVERYFGLVHDLEELAAVREEARG